MTNGEILNDIESYFKQLAKSRAIQIVQEKRILESIKILRQSSKSAADTGKERSDEPAWP